MSMRKTLPNCLLMSLVLLLAASAGVLRAGEPWRIVFRDEFNRKAGEGYDQTKWQAEKGGAGWGNRELQYYTDSTANAFHDGQGALVIRAAGTAPEDGLECWYGVCRYTSARLITKDRFEFTYGRVEARIKVPAGRGLWPAFWMLGNDIGTVGWPECGEIDVMENIGREPSTIHGTIHGPGYSGANGLGTPYRLDGEGAFADDFHVFAVEWSEGRIDWYADGNLYKSMTPEDLPEGARWAYDHPFYLLLNLAIGGPWGGDPDENTVFPAELKVDYVRVYQRSNRESYRTDFGEK